MEEGKAKTLAAAAAVLLGILVAVALAGLRPDRAGDEPADGSPGGYARVICMSPAAAEIAFAIGAGPRVVGISQWTTHPPEALDRPVCGGFANPNYERILALQPDLIVTQGAAEDLSDFARDNGITIVSLALTDLDSILEEAERLGRLLGLGGQAREMTDRLRARLQAVRRRAAGRPPVRTLLVTGREMGALNSIYTAGANTFLHDLIELAGGRNIFADLPVDYGTINKEQLIDRAPEVIVELSGEGGDQEAVLRRVRDEWRGLETLPAVRNDRVYVIEATWALIPGPRVVKLAERLVELLHPDTREAEQ